ncbi:MAG: Cna B-type domain-containing protein, partial [Clostridiales bacterium]|nr:Cna B-type domain-containing protein [Clostridiales bacterium]
MTVNLVADGTATGATLTLSGPSWTDTFTGLPKYKTGGIEIAYTVTENTVTNYALTSITGTAAEGYVITNTYDMEKVDVPVEKKWEHGDQPQANYP